MTKWAFIHLEGYCTYGTLPGKQSRPKWCVRKFLGRSERHPTIRCLNNREKMCEHFGYCDCRTKDKRVFGKAYYDMIHEEDLEYKRRNNQSKEKK